MAGKSNKARGRKGSHNASSSSNYLEPSAQSDVPAKDNVEGTSESAKADAAEVSVAGDSASANPEVKENEAGGNEGSQQKQGEPG